MPVRIVLDTTVVRFALFWRGTPHWLCEATRVQPTVRLLTSAVRLAELADVLSRPMAARRVGLIGRTAQNVMADYARSVGLVTPIAAQAVIAADSDDDHVLAAAFADILVSGDRHLLAVGTYRGIRILKPADADGLIGAA